MKLQVIPMRVFTFHLWPQKKWLCTSQATGSLWNTWSTVHHSSVRLEHPNPIPDDQVYETAWRQCLTRDIMTWPHCRAPFPGPDLHHHPAKSNVPQNQAIWVCFKPFYPSRSCAAWLKGKRGENIAADQNQVVWTWGMSVWSNGTSLPSRRWMISEVSGLHLGHVKVTSHRASDDRKNGPLE